MKKQKFLFTILALSIFSFTAMANGNGNSAVYTESDLVWEDDFNGKSLNLNDWNYEYHEKGWVNNELQEYVDSSKNIYVKNGNLIIQAIKTKDSTGKITYTSGRINTQGKHDFKYGRFEARIKAPKGKGFLPAFWMMPTDENLYGQWPKCGEIDIMEVLGNSTHKTYSTLHFGEPHTQRQGVETSLAEDFAEVFHIYACEWDPSEFRFYIDGKLFFKTNDWFTKKNGFGEVTYPAPYDQPFYLILNLAVGGNWPGNPDDSTEFKKNAQLVVDYVKVYQKKSYNENVTKPVVVSKAREADKNGNYVLNNDFSTKEELSDGKGWDFLLAGTGKATAEISNNMLNITPKTSGDLDYSIQVVQPDIPLRKGSKYRFSFEAWADNNRTIISAITAPNNGWIRYFPDTKMNITNERKLYTFDFTMSQKDDISARVEFNLGNQNSTEAVHISNVNVTLVEQADAATDVKEILPDGNYIYNSEFQEGEKRLSYWNIKNNSSDAKVLVTNENNIRELMVDIPSQSDMDSVSITQNDLCLTNGNTYILSFTSHADSNKEIVAKVAGETFNFSITTENKMYKAKFTVNSKDKKQTLEFLLGNKGITYLDNVRIQEDAMIINGDFSNNMTGYEVYTHDSAKTDFCVDSLSEDNAFCMNIENTGKEDWMIQLKQNNITMEKGKTYTISFDAKSTLDRTIMFAIQRNGANDNNWTPYSGTEKIDVSSKFKHYSLNFTMNETSDKNAILSISFGAVNGKQINKKHTVTIDNIKLTEIE